MDTVQKTAEPEHPHAESVQNPTKRRHAKQHTAHAANEEGVMKPGIINALNVQQKESV